MFKDAHFYGTIIGQDQRHTEPTTGSIFSGLGFYGHTQTGFVKLELYRNAQGQDIAALYVERPSEDENQPSKLVQVFDTEL